MTASDQQGNIKIIIASDDDHIGIVQNYILYLHECSLSIQQQYAYFIRHTHNSAPPRKAPRSRVSSRVHRTFATARRSLSISPYNNFIIVIIIIVNHSTISKSVQLVTCALSLLCRLHVTYPLARQADQRLGKNHIQYKKNISDWRWHHSVCLVTCVRTCIPC